MILRCAICGAYLHGLSGTALHMDVRHDIGPRDSVPLYWPDGRPVTYDEKENLL